MRGTTISKDSSICCGFQAGLTHEWNDKFLRTVHGLSVSVSCEEFDVAVFIASCFIPAPISQCSHRCQEVC